VTALYEVTLSREDYRSVDALRYQPKREKTQVIKNNEIGFVKLRYKKPHGSKDSILLSQVIAPKVTESIDTRFAAAVAAFGEKLRGGNNLSDFTYNDIVDLVKTSRGDDEHGYRAEFLRLVKLTQSIAS
ncbi:MAG: DUF3520 domain-containing protein, partial [Gammaproteobacteria bacterium]|nr:DUF3520 domain-containing protein [Gammaproteobacteria bacterium]